MKVLKVLLLGWAALATLLIFPYVLPLVAVAGVVWLVVRATGWEPDRTPPTPAERKRQYDRMQAGGYVQQQQQRQQQQQQQQQPGHHP